MGNYIRTYAEINLDNLKHNLEELKKCSNKEVKSCAVIKADAYGHGAISVSRFLEDKVDYFAVASANEALEIRKAGVKTPTLILTYSDKSEYESLIANDVSMTVYSKKAADELNEAAMQIGKKALVHIALDTGMTRIGFALDSKALNDILYISKLPNVLIQGVFSHYACADESNREVSGVQTERFISFTEKLKALDIDVGIRHMCNSAGIIDFDEHFDMVRMGISLYGLYPSDEVNKARVDLKPVMSFKSHVIMVKDVPEGVGISYGHLYHTKEPRKIATVCAGYCDGYPRAMTNIGKVIVRGKFASVTGRVCMDQFMIDVTDIEDVEVGDEVVMWGTDGKLYEPVDWISEHSMRFKDEVLGCITKRCPKVYIENSKTTEIVNYI